MMRKDLFQGYRDLSISTNHWYGNPQQQTKKNKNDVIISIGAAKLFDKIQHQFLT